MLLPLQENLQAAKKSPYIQRHFCQRGKQKTEAFNDTRIKSSHYKAKPDLKEVKCHQHTDKYYYMLPL